MHRRAAWRCRCSGWTLILLLILSLSGCGGTTGGTDPGAVAAAYVAALDRADTIAANRLLATTVAPWPASTLAEDLGPRCRPSGDPQVSVTGTIATVELACASGRPRMLMLSQETQGWKVLTR